MRSLIRFVPWFLGAILLLGACQEPQDATTPVSVLNEARQAWLASDFATAEARYQAYLQQYPDAPDRVEAWKRLADIAYAVRGQAAPAVALLETALLEKHLSPIQFFELSSMAMETAMRARQYDKTVFFAQNVLERTDLPSSVLPPVYLRLKQASLALGDQEHAVAILRECRAKMPNARLSAPCTLHLGLLLLKQGNIEAIPLLQALYADPQVEDILRAQAGFALGEAAEADHDTAKARYWYQAVKESHPNPKVVINKLELLTK